MLFNFLVDSDKETLAIYKKLNVENAVFISTKGDLSWCLEAYLILSRRAALPVGCSNRLRVDAINIVHSEHLLRLRGGREHFLVCVQADYPRRHWAQYHLVQNKNQLTADTSFVPHWVQPGLIGRDNKRVRVKTVGYVGPFNGNLAVSEAEWQQYLMPHGLQFVNLSAGSWHNLSAVDVLIGIRSFDTDPHNTKPPSRLFSAWHAHIPFVGGYDSAYTQVGTPGEDYLRVKTVEEVISAVLALRDNPVLYQKLVENGKKKALQYNNETIAREWERILAGPVLNRYIHWKEKVGLHG